MVMGQISVSYLPRIFIVVINKMMNLVNVGTDFNVWEYGKSVSPVRP